MLRQDGQPDTRLNWTAVAELARPAALAEPRLRAMYDPLYHAPDPKARLWFLLDLWASMHEAEWSEANVNALYEDIMDLFRDHEEADAWFREWREAHPEARLS